MHYRSYKQALAAKTDWLWLTISQRCNQRAAFVRGEAFNSSNLLMSMPPMRHCCRRSPCCSQAHEKKMWRTDACNQEIPNPRGYQEWHQIHSKSQQIQVGSINSGRGCQSIQIASASLWDALDNVQYAHPGGQWCPELTGWSAHFRMSFYNSSKWPWALCLRLYMALLILQRLRTMSTTNGRKSVTRCRSAIHLV